MTTAQQMRAWRGPAVLTVGFRLFFLLAGLWAVLAMALWIAMLAGGLSLPLALDPVSWHAHEFLWGYASAVMAGFLLTAVPNWTGRMPVVGWPVAALASLWLAGRIAMALSGWLPAGWVVGIDLAFLIALAAVLAREIIAGKNWRNLKILVLVGALVLGNLGFHLAALRGGFAAESAGLRLGLAATVLMILVIGGRVTPSFTRNWLVRSGLPPCNAGFGRADQVALGSSLAALAVWIAAPASLVAALLCLIAGAANLWRLSGWGGQRTLSEPLVTVLHAGYGLTALGFVAVGLAGIGLGDRFAAQHVWMAGGIATMTLAMMTRAALGHAGLPLTASRPVTAVYLAIVGATLARLLAGIPGWHDPMVWLSGALWLFAFGLYVIVYWPILVHARKPAG